MEFIDIINATPLVSIDLLVQSPDKKVVLGKRLNRPAMGFWFAPGGRIKKNEPLDAAVERIAKTELGLTLTRQQGLLLGAYDHIYDDNFFNKADVNTHYVALAYVFNLDEMPELQIDDQHSEVAWFSIDALLNHPEVHANTKAYFLDT